jgi:hypothetical protein
MPPVASTVVGRVSHVDLDGEGVSLRAPLCLPSSNRGRAPVVRRASFERLNPGRHSVWLRPGIPVASQNFFLFFSIFFCPAKGGSDPPIPSAFWVHSYVRRGPVSDANIGS